MKTVLAAVFTAIVTSISAPMAHAAFFLVELEKPWAPTSNERVKQTLAVSELEIIETQTLTYVLVEAKDEAYVQSYFYVYGVRAPKITEIRFSHDLQGSISFQDDVVLVGWSLDDDIPSTN